MTDTEMRALLTARGIRPRSISALAGGQKNVTQLVVSDAGDRYVVRRYATATAAEVDFELDAVAYLSARGFPTPAPVPVAGQRLAGQVGGRPAAVFIFAPGSHPASLETVHRDDLELGLQAAALAGRLHHLTWDRSFSGHRTDRLDPLRGISAYLDGPLAGLPTLAAATELLVSLRRTVAEIYATAPLPRGLVHNDISAHNLLLDAAGHVTAVLDFDDCMTSFLLFDLGRIIEVWGSGTDGYIDRGRVSQLIDAYNSERALSPDEKRHATSLIAAYAAATGCGYLTGRLRAGQAITGPDDSAAMSAALQLATHT